MSGRSNRRSIMSRSPTIALRSTSMGVGISFRAKFKSLRVRELADSATFWIPSSFSRMSERGSEKGSAPESKGCDPFSDLFGLLLRVEESIPNGFPEPNVQGRHGQEPVHHRFSERFGDLFGQPLLSAGLRPGAVWRQPL